MDYIDQVRLIEKDHNDRQKLREKIFMELAVKYASLSTCLSRHVGAVLVKDGNVLSVAYNGVPPGVIHCQFSGCKRKNCKSGQNLDVCFAIHAELNILGDCCRRRICTEDSTLYTTTFPCISCAKAMITARVKKIIFLVDYPDEASRHLLKESKIDVIQYVGDIDKGGLDVLK